MDKQKKHHKGKYIYLLIKYDKLLKNGSKLHIYLCIYMSTFIYLHIQIVQINLISCNTKKIGSKPMHTDKYIQTKLKSYNSKINTDFHNDGIPKDSFFFCIWFSIILIGSK